jgi:DNA-binding response OmpR family regulator
MTISGIREVTPRILIADDDASVVGLLADRCSLMGFEVETAFDGTQALHRIRQGGLDSLIIDVQMPGLDGLSVSAHVLEHSRTPLHVIIVTGRRDVETIGICDSMGALYVAKDIRFWENLDAALVEIYPANTNRIRSAALQRVDSSRERPHLVG